MSAQTRTEREQSKNHMYIAIPFAITIYCFHDLQPKLFFSYDDCMSSNWIYDTFICATCVEDLDSAHMLGLTGISMTLAHEVEALGGMSGPSRPKLAGLHWPFHAEGCWHECSSSMASDVACERLLALARDTTVAFSCFPSSFTFSTCSHVRKTCVALSSANSRRRGKLRKQYQARSTEGAENHG